MCSALSDAAWRPPNWDSRTPTHCRAGREAAGSVGWIRRRRAGVFRLNPDSAALPPAVGCRSENWQVRRRRRTFGDRHTWAGLEDFMAGRQVAILTGDNGQLFRRRGASYACSKRRCVPRW